MFQSIKNRFYIDGVGNVLDRVFSKDFNFRGESHNFIEAVFVISGCVLVTEDEKVYILNEGDIVFHAPMEFHCIKSYADTSPNVRNISFTVTGNLPSRIFDGVYHLNDEQRGLFMKCFDMAREYTSEDKSHKYAGQYLLSLMSELIIDISTALETQEAFSTEVSARLYREIVVEMQDSIYKNLSLCELAENNNISVSYLKKLFMRYANISPKIFYNSLRLKEACHLLDEGLSVASIAEKMNFSSPNYFSVFFKKHSGRTPLEYKKS